MIAPAPEWLRYFRLLLWNRWAEFNETWQEARSQWPLPRLNFGVDRKTKMVTLALDLPIHFRLHLWNRWSEFNATWQEGRSESILPRLCFSGLSENLNGPNPLFAETFSNFLCNRPSRIQQKLIGSQISTSATKFMFSGHSENQDSRPCRSVNNGAHSHCTQVAQAFWFAETLSISSLNPLNVIHRILTESDIPASSTKKRFFQAARKIKMAALADPSAKVTHCTQMCDMWPLGPFFLKYL